MKKRVLLIGQLPKEHGGSYTTGVANVITNLLPYLGNSSDNEFGLLATNLKEYYKGERLFGVKIFGLSVGKSICKLIKYILFHPGSIFHLVGYKKKYGIPPLRNLLYEVNIYYIIKEFKPDIIHVHNIKMLPAASFAANSKIKIILTFHGIQYEDVNSVEQNLKMGIKLPLLFREVSKLADHFTVLTQEMMNKVVALNIEPYKISVISNGVSGKFSFDPNAENILREQFDIKDNPLVFLSVGALTKLKNHIQAIRFLKNNFEDFRYIIIGKEGDFADRIKEEAKADKRIDILPYVANSQLYRYYSFADFLLHPSTVEGQPLVCLEALACGLPALINEKIAGSMGVEDCFLPYIKEVDLNASDFQLPVKLKRTEKEKLAFLSATKLRWDNAASKYMDVYEKFH